MNWFFSFFVKIVTTFKFFSFLFYLVIKSKKCVDLMILMTNKYLSYFSLLSRLNIIFISYHTYKLKSLSGINSCLNVYVNQLFCLKICYGKYFYFPINVGTLSYCLTNVRFNVAYINLLGLVNTQLHSLLQCKWNIFFFSEAHNHMLSKSKFI